MIHLIKGRHDTGSQPNIGAALHAANDDVFEGLVLPNLKQALRVVEGPRAQIAGRFAEEAAAGIGEAFRGNFRGAAASLAHAFAGGAGMIGGAMVGTALGGGVGGIIGMAVGGALLQQLSQWAIARWSSAAA